MILKPIFMKRKCECSYSTENEKCANFKNLILHVVVYFV